MSNRRLGTKARAFGLPQNLRYLIGIDDDQYARGGVYIGHTRANHTYGRVFIRGCIGTGIYR